MRSIQDYGPGTSPHELLGFLCDRILAGDLPNFESLRAFVDPLPDTAQVRAVVKRAFELLRRMYWGFFRDLSLDAFPAIWAQVVVADRRFPFAGDLKRLISISEVYLGLIDIHGYTSFCRKNRNNVSVLDRLDRILQEDLPRFAAASGVLSRRAQGDEILLLGASPSAVLRATLDAMACLSGGSGAPPAASGLLANAFLPEFAISAGIAGGQKFTPLLITRDGDLSGDIVNTAARLQARAGKICPDRNKILVTGPVRQKLKSDSDRGASGAAAFIDSGRIEFKGVSVPVYDFVFLEKESYRLSYADALAGLYDSLGKGLWRYKVFEDGLALIARIASNHPRITANASTSDGGHCCQEYLERIKLAQGHFNGERYGQAVGCLRELVDDLERVRGMDELAIEYLRGVIASYRALVQRLEECVDQELEAHLDTVLGQKERENYVTLRRNHAMFERVREATRLGVKGRGSIWQRVAEAAEPDLSFAIQAPK